MSLEVRSRAVGPWPMNTYVMVCRATGESVLFDPGAEPETLMEMLEGTTPVAIILTHTHGDHTGALAEMRERLGVPVMAFPGPYAREDPRADRLVHDGESIAVGSCRLRAIYTPGHTVDMISFMDEDGSDCIVGDTIFEGGPGRTWSAEEFQTTLTTLRTIVLSWPDDTMCHPGHGPSFRLGDIRPQIESFLAQDHGDFHGDAEWTMSGTGG